MEILSEKSYVELREKKGEDRLAMAASTMDILNGESIDTLRHRLETLRAEFEKELTGPTEEQSRFKPTHEEWSLNETCRHVARSMRRVALLSKALADGNAPEPDPKGGPGTMDDDSSSFENVKESVWAAFDTMAMATENLRNDVNTSTTAPHPWFGEKNCREWVAFNLIHMFVHVNQMRRIKAVSDFPAE